MRHVKALRLSPYHHHRLTTTLAEACWINTLSTPTKAMGGILVDMEIRRGVGDWGFLNLWYSKGLLHSSSGSIVCNFVSGKGGVREGRGVGGPFSGLL